MADKVQMINNNDITVLEAILHVIDNKNSDTPEYSDLLIDITDEKVKAFLKKHIIDSLKDDKILKAKFNLSTTNVVFESFKKVMQEPSSSVEQSKILTAHLFKFMVKRNISGGCLIISKYKDENDNIFLAILKMDYNDITLHERKTIDGKILNALITRDNALPSMKQKLQKCAFIKEYNIENSYDILILDKQPNKTDEDVALFFYKYFLDCTLCNDIKTNTANFFKKSCSFITEVYSDDPIKAKDKLAILYNTLKSSEVFNAVTFAELTFNDSEEIKNKYIQDVFVKNDLVFETQIDKEYVKNKLKRIQLNVVEGIEINVDSHILDDENVFKLDESEEKLGTYNISIKNVHLEEKWIKRKR